MTRHEVIKRMRELANLRVGDPMPDWLPANDWGRPLSELCEAAADELEARDEKNGWRHHPELAEGA